MHRLSISLRKFYHKTIHSIGFYPAFIAVLFLGLFVLVYRSETAEPILWLKQKFVWLDLKHTDAARSILTTIATGIIGLTVFSFSMMMVVMGQAASRMSNRLLDNLIGSRLQQITLGFYLGTIVASFFLLSVVDDEESIQVPSVAIFLLILLTIADLFLFVHFLHYISQSIRFEQLIKKIHQKTQKSLSAFTTRKPQNNWSVASLRAMEVCSPFSGYFQGINSRELLRYLAEHDLYTEFLLLRCTYVVKGEPFLQLYYKHKPSDEALSGLFENIDFYSGQEIDKNPFYGFLHLSEVAVKALSPGINDPNTAVLCIHALTDLLIIKMKLTPLEVFTDASGKARIRLQDHSFGDMFRYCIYPIWDYGKNDRFVQHAFERMLKQITQADQQGVHTKVITAFKTEMADVG